MRFPSIRATSRGVTALEALPPLTLGEYIWLERFLIFEAQERTGTGKGAARQARRAGMVPGIVFGGDADPLPINIPFNVLLKAAESGPL